jgi:hypothetical protein
MKKMFLFSSLAFFFAGAEAQTVQRQKDYIDTVAKATDSTALISVRDIVEFDALMQQKFSVKELATYQELLKFWQDRIAVRVREYEAKKKGGK